MIGKKIVFMGTGPFAYEILKNLYFTDHTLLAVFTKEPKEQGRGMKVIKNPVQLFAEKFSLDLRMPRSLSSAKDYLLQLQADLMVVASYGLIIPKDLLWLYRSGVINLHPSALPRWRGAAPIERSMMAADEATDICVMQMDEGLDTGPILMRHSLPLDIRFSGAQLTIDYAKISSYLLLETLTKIDSLIAQPQDASSVTYAKKILSEDEKIDWNSSGSNIIGKIMALSPKAFCFYNEQRLRIVTATLTGNKSNQLPGTIIDQQLKVVCGDGSVIKINKIQKSGGKIMDVQTFLYGNKILVGDVFT